MSKLTLAMGAEHIAPNKLAEIVNIINRERQSVHDLYRSRIAVDRIADIYNVCGTITIDPMSYSVEEKYDGFSYLNVDGKFFSKRLSEAKDTKGQPIEKTGHVPHLSIILRRAYEMCGCDLHGEIYIPGGISDDVTKILGCTEEEAVRRLNVIRDSGSVTNMPHFRLIDIRAIYGKSLINEPQYIRRAILEYVYKEYIEPYDDFDYIQLAERLYGDPRDEFRRIVRAGGEGIIIKRSDALYIPDKKPTNNWIKGKKKITHDVIMLGLNEGTGKNKEIFGSIKFGHIIDGKIVACGNCSSGLSDEMRLFIYNNTDELIANKQVFEIEAIQESVKSFRNAVFLRLRNDKSWSECEPVNIRIKDELI